MLYSLFEYLNKTTDLPGMRVVEYISFRSAAAIILSLLISIFFGG
jgi:phospho-N-acetylmuramoyl-pentapeptide-transferase